MRCKCGGMMRLDLDDHPSCVWCGFVDYGPRGSEPTPDPPGQRHHRSPKEIARATLLAQAYRARGWSLERIAQRIGVSRHTVATDLKRTP